MTWKDKKAKAYMLAWSRECVCVSVRVRACACARSVSSQGQGAAVSGLGAFLVCFKAPCKVYPRRGEQWKVGCSL